MLNDKERREGVSKKEIFDRTKGFLIGDEVVIPVSLMDEYNSVNYPNGIHGTVKQVCTKLIVFTLENGTTRSLSRFDCMNVKLLKRSGFSSYGEESQIKDMTDAIQKGKNYE